MVCSKAIITNAIIFYSDNYFERLVHGLTTINALFVEFFQQWCFCPEYSIGPIDMGIKTLHVTKGSETYLLNN